MPVTRPCDKDLEPFFDKAGKLTNHSEDHVLNTTKALARLTKEVSAYCFTGTDAVIMYAGYADGLIL